VECSLKFGVQRVTVPYKTFCDPMSLPKIPRAIQPPEKPPYVLRDQEFIREFLSHLINGKAPLQRNVQIPTNPIMKAILSSLGVVKSPIAQILDLIEDLEEHHI